MATQILHGQRVVTEMTPQIIADAIRAGEKGEVADGTITKSSGWSWGSIHIATFSTPFMRVAMAARAAKKAYRQFRPEDVTPEMIAPELHIYAWSQMNGDEARRGPVGGNAIHDRAGIGPSGCTRSRVRLPAPGTRLLHAT